MLKQLFKRRPQRTFADYLHRSVFQAPISEGPVDKLLERQMLTYPEGSKVEIYACDVRHLITVMQARVSLATRSRIEAEDARDSALLEADRSGIMRIDYHWATTKLIAFDDAGGLGHDGISDLLGIVSRVLGGIKAERVRDAACQYSSRSQHHDGVLS